MRTALFRSAKLINVLLAGVAVLCLVALSWGIAASNVVACCISGTGIAVIIVVAGSSLLAPDDLRSQATERMLRVASGTLRHMRGGLSVESCQAVCQLLLPETNAAAICMTDAERTLAFVGEVSAFHADDPNSEPTMEVLKNRRMQTFTNLDKMEWSSADGEMDEHEKLYPAGIIAPLLVSDQAVGTLKLYYRHGREIDRTQLSIARGFSELLSAQLSEYELDRQAELTARAEIKALQSQINPHFLFNSLNTMAALTRTDPAKARDLLREFAAFYRKTLESSEEPIPLSEEIDQVRRYLKIERARFGDDRIITSSAIDPRVASLRVPSFLVQPIVENSVRHAMGEGPLHIDVQATVDDDDVLIAVADDGVGMDEATAAGLLAPQPAGGYRVAAGDTGEKDAVPGKTQSASSKGTGIALRNVAERIERFYGKGSNVEIMSKLGQGTVVTLRLAGAAHDLA